MATRGEFGDFMAFKTNIDSERCIFTDGSCKYVSSSTVKTTKKVLKYGFIFYIAFSVLISTTGYFFGFSMGGTGLASSYVAISLCASVMMAISAIPFAGTAALIGYYYIMDQVMSLLGVLHNFYVDVFIMTLTMVIAVSFQVFSTAWTLYVIHDQYGNDVKKLKFEA